MIFLDTPGIHLKATKTLNKVLNHSALSVIEDSDLVLFVMQRTSLQDQDRQVLNKIKESKVPSICVLNKIDQVQNKNDLLPLIQEIDSIHPFSDYVPTSAKNHDGIWEAERHNGAKAGDDGGHDGLCYGWGWWGRAKRPAYD